MTPNAGAIFSRRHLLPPAVSMVTKRPPHRWQRGDWALTSACSAAIGGSEEGAGSDWWTRLPWLRAAAAGGSEMAAERDEEVAAAERGPGAAYQAFVLMEELRDKLKLLGCEEEEALRRHNMRPLSRCPLRGACGRGPEALGWAGGRGPGGAARCWAGHHRWKQAEERSQRLPSPGTKPGTSRSGGGGEEKGPPRRWHALKTNKRKQQQQKHKSKQKKPAFCLLKSSACDFGTARRCNFIMVRDGETLVMRLISS